MPTKFHIHWHKFVKVESKANPLKYLTLLFFYPFMPPTIDIKIYECRCGHIKELIA